MDELERKMEQAGNAALLKIGSQTAAMEKAEVTKRQALCFVHCAPCSDLSSSVSCAFELLCITVFHCSATHHKVLQNALLHSAELQ